MSSFHLTIVCPVCTAFDADAEFVSAPGVAGSFGIQAHHAPFVTTLKSGVISIKSSAGDKTFIIGSGILEMNKENKCLILANKVENSA